MAEAVVLGDLELDRVTALTIQEQRKLALHAWPGGDGDLVQDLGAAAARIRLEGVATGETAGDLLGKLRQAMQSGKPQDFAASAAVSANIDQAIIAALEVHQPPGRPNYYEYRLELVRYVPPPAPPAAGFDLGAVSDINAAVAASAAADLGGFMTSTGKLGSALQGIDEAVASAGSALSAAEEIKGALAAVAEVAESVVGAIEDLGALKDLMEKAGKVVSALAS